MTLAVLVEMGLLTHFLIDVQTRESFGEGDQRTTTWLARTV
jgi:hypothetical protein